MAKSRIRRLRRTKPGKSWDEWKERERKQEEKALKELNAYWAGSMSGMLRKKEIKGVNG